MLLHPSPADIKYQPIIYETDYRVVMRLTIKNVAMSDLGAYKCVAKNSLGDTDGLIKLYRKYRQRQRQGQRRHPRKDMTIGQKMGQTPCHVRSIQYKSLGAYYY